MDHLFPATTSGLLVGRAARTEKTAFGFSTGEEAKVTAPSEDVVYDGDGHLMTIAPTGAGKGVGCVVPALLRHNGPVIALDVKGENYAMTRRHRRAMGSKILCIDPFGIAARLGEDNLDEIAGFNPFDLLPYLSDDHDTACRALANMMISPDSHATDPFWRDSAVGTLAALIDCYDHMEGPSRSISAIIQDLSTEAPGANYVGKIPAKDIGMASMMHNPTLMDMLDENGATPYDIWVLFEASGGKSLGVSRPLDVKAIVEAAAKMGMQASKWTDEDLDREDIRDKEGRRISESLVGEASQMSNFQVMLERTWPALLEDPLVAEELWALLREAVLTARMGAELGSFGQENRAETPENYPLAMHHIARCSTPLCRSMAAQPFTSDRTWGSIICVLRAELAQFSGRSVAHSLSGAFDLEVLRRGDDVSVYIAFPPLRIRSHSMLFRVMVEGIMSVILSRQEQPERRTLFILDEIAQLGHLDLLVTAMTLLRGYGVQVWSFWQDISQLTGIYPKDWRTLMNNCKVVQLFGRGMGGMSSELASALDVSHHALLGLAPENLLAWVDSPNAQTLKRPVCYADEDLKNLCDDGPFAKPAVKKPTTSPDFEIPLEEDHAEEPEDGLQDVFERILSGSRLHAMPDMDLF